jgi:hypothetical protein
LVTSGRSLSSHACSARVSQQLPQKLAECGSCRAASAGPAVPGTAQHRGSGQSRTHQMRRNQFLD